MVREVSSGGVVLHRISAAWHIAVIEPRRDQPSSPPPAKRKSQSALLALPKGLVDPGEDPIQTAIREVHEETGISAVFIAKLANIKYVYVRSWGDKQRVFKIVSFYLLRYQSGQIDNLTPEMRVEVKRALWLPLADALTQLSYSSERDVVRRAQQYVDSHPEV
jgi:8-oxo-dGTP diphosphatase